MLDSIGNEDKLGEKKQLLKESWKKYISDEVPAPNLPSEFATAVKVLEDIVTQIDEKREVEGFAEGGSERERYSAEGRHEWMDHLPGAGLEGWSSVASWE